MTKRVLAIVIGICCLTTVLPVANSYAYDYPFTDRYVATVLGTPPEFAAPLPEKIPTKIATLRMFPNREVPNVLWNFAELKYSYTLQEHEAPLIFLIAGTGASFHSAKMVTMQKAFYQAGYHVVSLPSPTHPNFIVAASCSSVPGHLMDDAQDLYRVMKKIKATVLQDVPVSRYCLTGYSLGAAQSAFISYIDEHGKAFNFDKVLLINPPVSLYNSVQILDKLLEDNLPGGMDNFNEFYQQITKYFSEVYAKNNIDFNDSFLYAAYTHRKPKDNHAIKALIGLDFRLSSGNMAFASDVMTKAGYVVPRNKVIGKYENTTQYARILYRLTFLDYFNDIFVPNYAAKDATNTVEKLLNATDIRCIDQYLRTSTKIGLIGNQDDIILAPGEIDYLQQLFGDRATIFPYGGHCGNMGYPDNIAAMVDFFHSADQK